MANDPFRFKLGLFVVSGIGLGVAGITAVGAGRFMKERQPLTCYFRESIQGLGPESPVSFRGIEIGRVKTVRMFRPPAGSAAGEEPVILVGCEIDPTLLGVESKSLFSLSEDTKLFLRAESAKGLRVQVQWADLTGKKYLLLDYMHGDSATIDPLGFAPEEPWVPTYTSPSLTSIQRDLASTVGSLSQIDYARLGERMTTVLESLDAKLNAADVAGISTEAKATLVALRETAQSGAVRRTLERMDRITETLEGTVKSFDELVASDETKDAVHNASVAARELRELSEALSDKLPATVERLDTLIADVTQAIAAADVARTTDTVRTAAADVGEAARGMKSLRNAIQLALRDLSAMSRRLARLSETLDTRPPAMLDTRKRP